MTINIYKVEVGVLLSKDNEEYEDYNGVYDKQHGFYDENVSFFTDKDEAVDYAKKYVADGIINTYAIVKLLKYNIDEQFELDGSAQTALFTLDEIKRDIETIQTEHTLENWIDMFGEENFDMNNIVLSVTKSENGETKENFLITEQSLDYSHMLPGERALFDMMEEMGLDVIEVRDFGLVYQDMPITHAIAMEHWKTHKPCVMLTSGNPADGDALYVHSEVQDIMGITNSEFESVCNKIVELF